MQNDRFCQLHPDLQAGLREWFGKSPGEVLLELERASLEQLLPGLFGYYLLQLGQLDEEGGLLASSRFRTNLALDLSGVAVAGVLRIRGDPARLPVATDSVDTVLMPHTLDFSPDPHQVLREAERVLIPEGRLLILGFNPWSLWGVWRLFRIRSQRLPWCGRFLSLGRVKDWLSLMGFELERTRFLMYRPPLTQPGLMRRLEFFERLGGRFWAPLAGVYLIQAVKRVSTLTPLQPAWKPRARLLKGQVVEPTTRIVND